MLTGTKRVWARAIVAFLPPILPTAAAMSSPVGRAAGKTLGTGTAAMSFPALGFGCMGITAFYGRPLPDTYAVRLLVRAAELGCSHWDTAEVYRATDPDTGETIYNEEVVGKGIATVGREGVTVASKYMPKLHGDELTPEVAVQAARASCRRLGVEQMDLYYVHRMASKSTVEEQAEAMNAVKAAGLTRYVGVSEFNPDNLRKFHEICPVTCVQQEWSLMNRDLEEDLLPVCRELGIGVVAYSPICRGLLSGTVRSRSDLPPDDLRAERYGRFQDGNLERNAALVEPVAELAERKGVTVAQLSLAWACHRGEDVVPIPGTTKISHLDDNAAAASLSLEEDEVEVLSSAVPREEVAGDRFANVGNRHALTYKDNPF